MGWLGFGEIVVILLLALILFGPKKLPEIGRMLGKGIREVRKLSDMTMNGIMELDEFEGSRRKKQGGYSNRKSTGTNNRETGDEDIKDKDKDKDIKDEDEKTEQAGGNKINMKDIVEPGFKEEDYVSEKNEDVKHGEK